MPPDQQPALFAGVATCSICGRPLRHPRSIARGTGPICSGRGYTDPPETEPDMPKKQHTQNQRLLTPAWNPEDPDSEIRLERRHGDAWTNVIQVCINHSPTGFEWGYGGSGPADLALNIAAQMYPVDGEPVGSRTWNGELVSHEAWHVYQAIKRHAIEGAPRDGGAFPTSELWAIANAELERSRA